MKLKTYKNTEYRIQNRESIKETADNDEIIDHWQKSYVYVGDLLPSKSKLNICLWCMCITSVHICIIIYAHTLHRMVKNYYIRISQIGRVFQ